MGRNLMELPAASWAEFRELFSAFFSAALGNTVTFDGVAPGNMSAVKHYGLCSTLAATAEKTVACAGFTLAEGARIAVRFSNTNTAANPKLNVNSTGGKAIYYRGAAISAGYLAADRTYQFVYNGAQYELVGDLNTDTTYSEATTSAAGLMSASDKTKLNGIASGAQANTITGVKGDSESSYRTGNVNITKENIGLGNVDNTADENKSVSYAANAGTVNNHTVDADVPSGAKFTDTTYSAMSASEATTGTSTTARTITAKVLADYVAACVATLVNSAPATLDTLKELADALGNDPNFATTMATALGNKLGKTETAANATKATGDKNGADITTTYFRNARVQQGNATIYNKFVIDGCVIKAAAVSGNRNLQLTRTGTYASKSRSTFFADGGIHTMADGTTVAVPTNSTSSAVTYYACIVKNSNTGAYELKVQTSKTGVLGLYRITVPASHTGANLTNVTITDERRIEASYGQFYASRSYVSVALPTAFSSADYDVSLRAISWSGVDVGTLLAYDLANNGFKVEATGAADNIDVRWIATAKS